MANNLRRLSLLKYLYVTEIQNISRNTYNAGIFRRTYGSALFISGRNANKVFSFISPYLDLDSRLLDTDKLQADLTLRGLNVNVVQIKQTWEMYKQMTADKNILENRLTELRNRIIELSKVKDSNTNAKEQIEQVKLEMTIVKQDMKVMKEALWDMDETFITKMLQLPNELDQRTPPSLPKLLQSRGTLPQVSRHARKSHIEIGKSLGILEYQNPLHYYLCNEAALFELGVLNYAGKFLSEHDMLRMAGPDFARGTLVEGSGLNHEDPAEAFILEHHNEVAKDSENRMHLVGGASLVAFLAMHAKQLINPKDFPLRYYAAGRQYTPFPEGSVSTGLFTACQASAVQAFIAVKEKQSEEYTREYEKLLDISCQLYDNICDHYRIVMKPVSELRAWESMRISFELWSAFAESYVEVGHISLCGDYFSKRLLIAYQTPTGRNFPAVISGTLLSVPKLLGCLLEQNPDKFVISQKIAEHMPVDCPEQYTNVKM